jgi:hypothetical protein
MSISVKTLVGHRVRPAHGAPNQLLMAVHREFAKQDGKRIQVPLTHAARTSEAKTAEIADAGGTWPWKRPSSTGKLFHLVEAMLDRIGIVTTWNFLRLLQRRSLNSRRRVIIITDNAKYHHAKLHSAWRQKNKTHFRLDYLPPYSPDLNPIERVWKLTRKLCIHDQYFQSLAAVITAVENPVWQMDKRLGAFVLSNYIAFIYVPVYNS